MNISISRTWSVAGAALAAGLLGVTGVTAGPIGGTARVSDAILGLEYEVYSVAVGGNEETTFTLQGAGTTDLDLMIFDEFGNMVGIGAGPQDRESVTVYSIRSEILHIAVVNHGSQRNAFVLTAQ